MDHDGYESDAVAVEVGAPVAETCRPDVARPVVQFWAAVPAFPLEASLDHPGGAARSMTPRPRFFPSKPRTNGIWRVAGLARPFGLALVLVMSCGEPGDLWREVEPVVGTLSVPLDEDDPRAGEVGLAFVLYPARDESRRVGTLVFHFGGPGSSAVDGLVSFVPRLARTHPQIVDTFDVAGFDELGVGQSQPLTCFEEVLPFPGEDEGRSALAAARAYAEDCERSAESLGEMGTARLVRDMDRFRSFLGEEELHLVGYSYGSMVAMGYASAFPSRVGRVVLDAVADPRAPLEEWLVLRALLFESELNGFLDRCAAGPTPCRFGGRDAQSAFDQLLFGLRSDLRPPLPAHVFLGVVALMLTDTSLRPELEDRLVEAENGHFRRFIDLAQALAASTTAPAFHATLCPDRPAPSREHYLEVSASLVARAPRFSSALASTFLPCIYWPAEPELFDPSLERMPPVVMVHSARDPRTPRLWADRVAGRIGGRAFIEVRGAAHGTSLLGNPCVDARVVSFLVGGDLPADTTCPE